MELKDVVEVKTTGVHIYKKLVTIIKMIWNFNMFFWLWFNMLTIPCIMLWPDLCSELENYVTWLILWLNELMWLTHMIYNCFV